MSRANPASTEFTVGMAFESDPDFVPQKKLPATTAANAATDHHRDQHATQPAVRIGLIVAGR